MFGQGCLHLVLRAIFFPADILPMNILGFMRFAIFFVATIALTSAAVGADASGDVFTPVIASTLSPETHAVHGTDNAYHIVYELQLTNTRPLPATIRSIDVLEAPNASKLITSFSGPDVVKRLRTLAPAPAADAKIGPNEVRLFYIELAFKDAANIPRALEHRLHLLAAASPGPGEPKPLDYVVAHIKIAADKPVVIGAPLAGAGWVAGNGCCNPEIIHRGSVLSVNGALYDAQRFAIDWMRLDEQGRLVHGYLGDVHNYTCYGADVLAVADGKVVGMLKNLDDQKPGKLPDPDTITIDTVDGNHVVLDIGGGYFAFYAHLQKNSVTVHVGDQVKKGAVLGRLGNSGNTSGPHLHFHIMTGSSVLGSDGVPYVLESFNLAGQIDIAAFEAAPDLTGNWGKGSLSKPERHQSEFPLNLNIIDFPSGQNSK
jgi:murein DD-endopeptidase MepM/ murein hydrolase activator NlpD